MGYSGHKLTEARLGTGQLYINIVRKYTNWVHYFASTGLYWTACGVLYHQADFRVGCAKSISVQTNGSNSYDLLVKRIVVGTSAAASLLLQAKNVVGVIDSDTRDDEPGCLAVCGLKLQYVLRGSHDLIGKWNRSKTISGSHKKDHNLLQYNLQYSTCSQADQFTITMREVYCQCYTTGKIREETNTENPSFGSKHPVSGAHQ
jgi:hypothetical protein